MLGKIEAGNEDVEEQFSSFDVDPSDQFLSTVARRSRLIQVWNLQSMKEVASWKASHALPVLDMAYSPTGMDIATCSADKSIVVYSVRREGVVTHRFATGANRQGHKSRVVRIFWHPSPKRMVRNSKKRGRERKMARMVALASVSLALTPPPPLCALFFSYLSVGACVLR
jgi:WD40 repeat protein